MVKALGNAERYLCPFCVTKLEKLDPKCPECHHKMDWSRFIEKKEEMFS